MHQKREIIFIINGSNKNEIIIFQALKTETFSNFKALRKLILPTAASGLVEEVCAALKESLETVCTGSCDTKSFECPDAPEAIEDDLLNVVLPGTIPFVSDDNEDPSVSTASDATPETDNKESVPAAVASNVEDAAVNESAISFRATVMQAPDVGENPSETESKATETESNPAAPAEESASPPVEEAPSNPTDEIASKPTEEVSAKTAVLPKLKAAEDPAAPTGQDTTKTEGEVVGATTSDAKTGGVDKSVILIVVAGMVVVVAGITIKKNWTSIKNRFSSTPRSANDRTANANGTTPEEVPLQEKSPV